MFMPFMFLLLVASVPLFQGSLRHLADLRLQRTGLALTALLLQVVMTSLPGLPRLVLVALHLSSYATVAFVLWPNRRLPGLGVLVAGAASNAFVIALNGGTLPASARALDAAGWADDGAFANSATLSDPVLGWLGDIAATPAWLPFRNVISIGDVLILVGAAWLLHVTCHSRVPAALTALRRRWVPRRAVVAGNRLLSAGAATAAAARSTSDERRSPATPLSRRRGPRPVADRSSEADRAAAVAAPIPARGVRRGRPSRRRGGRGAGTVPPSTAW